LGRLHIFNPPGDIAFFSAAIAASAFGDRPLESPFEGLQNAYHLVLVSVIGEKLLIEKSKKVASTKILFWLPFLHTSWETHQTSSEVV